MKNRLILSQYLIIFFLIYPLSLCPTQLEYPIDLPVLGSATLNGSIDIVKSEFSLSGTLTSAAASLELGPLLINKPTISLSNTKGLGLTARGTLFESEVEIGIKEITSKDRIVLGATFITKPTITITADQKITLDEIDITLERNKPALLTTKAELFSHDVIITIGGNKEKALLLFEIPQLKMSSIDSSLENTEFKNIELNNCSFSVMRTKANPEKNIAKKVEFELSGKANFSSVEMDDVSANVSSLMMKAYYEAEHGLILQALFNSPIEYPLVGQINQASLVFFSKLHRAIPALDILKTKKISEWDQHLPTDDLLTIATPQSSGSNLFLSGSSNISLPTLGTLALEVEARFAKNKFAFEGKVKKEVTLSRLTLQNASLLLSRDPNITVSLQGKGIIDNNLEINASLALIFHIDQQAAQQQTKSPAANKNILLKAQCDIELTGSLLSTKPYAPFENVSIPGLSSSDLSFLRTMTLENVQVGYSRKANSQTVKQDFHLDGSLSVWGNRIQGRVTFGETPEGVRGVTVRAELPSGWKFSSINPALEKLDTIELASSSLYFSSFEHKETDPNDENLIITIPKGLSLYATLSLEKALPQSKKFMQAPSGVTLSGSFSTNGQFRFGAALPTALKFDSKKFKSAGLTFVIGNSPGSKIPYIALEASLMVKPSEKDDELTFTAQIKPDVEEMKISGTMQGSWDAPLGIYGLTIKDIALEADITYAQIVTGIPISGIGFVGSLQLAGGKTDKKMALAFHITENVSDMFISGKYDRALSIFELVDIFKNLTANAIEQMAKDNRNSAEQAKLQKQMDTLRNIDIAKDFVGIYFHDINVHLAAQSTQIGMLTFDQGLTIAGKLDIFGQTAAVSINLDYSGVHVSGSLPAIVIGPIFALRGTQSPANPQGGPSLDMQLTLEKQAATISGFLTFLGITRGIEFSLDKDGFYTKFSQKLFGLFDANLLLRSSKIGDKPDFYIRGELAQNVVTTFCVQIVEQLTAALNNAINQIQSPKQQVQGLSGTTSDIQKQIDSLKKQVDDLSKTAVQAFLNSGKIIALEAQIAALKFRQGGTIVGQKIGEGALTLGESFLKGVQKLTSGVGKIPDKILDIKSIILETSAQEWAAGKLPVYTIQCSLFGTNRTMALQLDLSNQEKTKESIRKMAEQCMRLVQ